MPKQDPQLEEEEAVASLESELKRNAHAGAEAVREKANIQADVLSSRFGERAATLADAVHSAGETARGKEDWFADAALMLSDQISQLAEASQGKSGQEILREAEHIARERPALVMGAAVVTGLALGRLLRSSIDDDEVTSNYPDPGASAEVKRPSSRGATTR